jgi:hypothetical protein
VQDQRVMDETQDEGGVDPERWRNDWFAEQLGDRWHTSGDGIYTYVPDEPRSSWSDYTSIQPIGGLSKSRGQALGSQ